jgi:glycerol-3-phosphate dehydrogenase (NAD(P)+)
MKLEEILAHMHMVAEGVRTTRSVYGLGREYGIELPITEQVYEVLYKGKDPREAVQELMGRRLRDE